MSRWLTEGRTLGASLRSFSCIVVAGPDRDATAEVALGVAEAQAAHRRVVLGDLLDDAARFARLRVDDDPHGLVDSIHYGISLSKVTRPVAGTVGLFFAPTGSDVTDYAELLAHPRWARLIQSFAEAKELLVIAVPSIAAGLDDLVVRTDGIVLVDGQIPAKLDGARVIAHVRAAPQVPAASPHAPPHRPVVAAGAAAAAAAPGALRPKAVVTQRSTTVPAKRPTRSSGSGPRPSAAPPAGSDSSRPSSPSSAILSGSAAGRRIPGLNRSVVVGALGTLAAALFVFWLAERSPAESESPAKVVAAVAPIVKPTPARTTGKSVDPNLADPADSGAAVFAVQIMAANTQAGAILKLQELGPSLPAPTYAPVAIQGKTWFKVVAGAFVTRGGADSLLASLRAGSLLDSTEGVVVHVPFSLRIDSLRASATLSEYLTSLRVGRSLPVYTLIQRSGWVWVMVGAFETRSQADIYAETLRLVDLTPQLVFRQGRVF